MSEWGKVPREVFLDDRLTRRDLRVLGILCTHADGRTGVCTRKQESIAEEIGADRSGVNRSIGKLVKLGYVDTDRAHGLRRELVYRVTRPVIDPPRQAKRARPAKANVKQGLRMSVFERDGFRCRHCGSQSALQADHVFPESSGGPTTIGNLQTLCRSCNQRKGSRLPSVMP